MSSCFWILFGKIKFCPKLKDFTVSLMDNIEPFSIHYFSDIAQLLTLVFSESEMKTQKNGSQATYESISRELGRTANERRRHVCVMFLVVSTSRSLGLDDCL